jgi:hypothetical protein
VSGAARIDHLVIAATDLNEGVAWCERLLGVPLAPGGRHRAFATHNRVLRLQGDLYLEVIAVDPEATAGTLPRWFDLDDAALQRRLAAGPALVHWVAEVPDLAAARSAWQARGIDAGRLLAASRETPEGLLAWTIAVRDDGRRPLGGLLPTLIAWGDRHPTAALPERGVALTELTLQHPQPARFAEALAAVGLGSIPVGEGPAAWQVTLRSPAGEVTLAGFVGDGGAGGDR